jgi:hypothetical protein
MEDATHSNIEQDLIAAIEPIRGFVFASVTHHFFNSGLLRTPATMPVAAKDSTGSILLISPKTPSVP